MPTEAAELTLLAEDIAGCSACFPDGGNAPVFVHRPGARVLVIGQAPSLTDSRTGSTFSGPGGKRLRAWLDQAGIPEADVSFSALTKCYPGKSSGGKGDRTPTRGEIAACRGFLVREVRALRPRVVLLIGGMASNELLRRAPLADLVGNVFDGSSSALIAAAAEEPAGISVVPLPHCSGASLWLNRPEHQELLGTAIDELRGLYAAVTV
ncbi:hypothetical protein HN371_20100 [Candidatus Poribacteria bacterium]|nr:hypothetical protein [Candidatus Poribacteria bacterium]MBT5535708.1 hypothetical protein [Candidatus Poribacteria bacterium]MBT5710429.1 hypothetical protein [Candidatus Poribacteria bacterium]MBT7098891.1 hypothetical protein [Candidatus Poribacteria bacterium]MBT7804161.1 hypothetical protein [Candidatus Poribacteria bacterium]